MRDRLRPALADLETGAVYPDLILTDFDHHAYCLETWCGDAPDTIAREYAEILADFRPRPFWHGALAALASPFPAGCSPRRSPTGIVEEKRYNLAFRLGVISHYAADVNVPYHTVPYVEPLKTRHLANLDRLAAAPDGRTDDLAADLRSFAIGQAHAAREDLATVDQPSLSHDSPRYWSAVDRSYSRAVNAVADIWYTILTRVTGE
jgi:hypothetical protein